MTMRSTCSSLALIAAFAGVFAPSGRASSLNLIKNGGFETNGGVGELAGGITTLADWTVGAAVDGNANPFAFVVDANADSSGFPSVFSPPNIYVYGPGTPASEGGPVNNGFTGSPDGGYFLGVDGDYAKAPVSQDVDGLIVGQQYTLSFEWAGAQFTRFSGAMNDWWNVTFGGESVSTPQVHNASHGFTGWQTFSYTFTATQAKQTLTFLAGSDGIGAPPFLLLDGVSLTTAVPEPGSLLLMGVSALGMLGVGWRRTRARSAA